MMKRIVIGGKGDREMGELERLLQRLHFEVIAKAKDASSLIRQVRMLRPDLVLVQGEEEFLEIAKVVEENELAAVVVTLEGYNRGLQDYLRENWNFQYIIKPLVQERISLALDIAWESYQQRLELERQAEILLNGKTTRKLVAEAMSIMVAKNTLTESQAIHRIQIKGLEFGLTIRDVAKIIIKGKEIA